MTPTYRFFCATRELVDIIFLKKLANALEIKYALIKFSCLTFGTLDLNVQTKAQIIWKKLIVKKKILSNPLS